MAYSRWVFWQHSVCRRSSGLDLNGKGGLGSPTLGFWISRSGWRLRGSAVASRTGRHGHEGTVQSTRKILIRIIPRRSNYLHSAPTQSTMSPHLSGVSLSRDWAVNSRRLLQAVLYLQTGMSQTQNVCEPTGKRTRNRRGAQGLETAPLCLERCGRCCHKHVSACC